MINLTVLSPLRIPAPIRVHARTHVCVCNTSYLFWLSMMGSVMRCHQNQINLKSGSPAPDAPCQLLFLPPDRTHAFTHAASIQGRVAGGGTRSFVSASHLQCICRTVSAPVKVNTTPSLWPNQYCLLSVWTHWNSHSSQQSPDLFIYIYKSSMHIGDPGAYLILLVVYSSL